MNKQLALVAAIALALPLAATAQTAPAKAPAKASADAPKKPQRQVTRKAAKAVEEVTPISEEVDVELSAGDLELARRVHVGRTQCELGADVTVQLDEKKPGFFLVWTKNLRFRMHPVESRTGAIRLEDPRQGAMWLQLGNKSMLMNQKQGLRIADECQNAEQLAFAEEMKRNPPKPLFEGADPSPGVRATDATAAAVAAAPEPTPKKRAPAKKKAD